MKEIHKKTWPELFEKVLEGKKNFDLRLADFEINEGDTLILEEYEPKTKKYTGRKIKKKTGSIIKLNPVEMWDIDDIKKFGFYIIEMK
ncbi:MAG: DUF3850 domain-containing protein [Candidatus Nanoarchaeia archaeon]|nr:DUF3850 domain-containing protein [Candidatus Nanoarchaeia archaeon]